MVLDRELHIWDKNFNGAKNTQGHSQEDEDFTIPSLKLMSNVCMLLIHLPALTFDPEVPQFSHSLKACVLACRNTIEIFNNNNKDERRLFYLQPNGARLVFQSALTWLYDSWHRGVGSELETETNEQNAHPDVALNDLINAAVGLLEMQASECLEADLGGLQGQSWKPSDILQAAISTLKKLAAQTTQDRGLHLRDVITIQDSPVGENSQHQRVPTASTSEPWRLSPLDDPNHLDIEWNFDPAPPDHNAMDSNFLDASMLL